MKPKNSKNLNQEFNLIESIQQDRADSIKFEQRMGKLNWWEGFFIGVACGATILGLVLFLVHIK